MPADISKPPTPELDKLTAVQNEYFTIEQFLDWLGSHGEYTMARHNRCLHWTETLLQIPECIGQNPDCPPQDLYDHRVNVLMPIIPLTSDERNTLVHKYFGLDAQAIARERNTILQQLREDAAQR